MADFEQASFDACNAPLVPRRWRLLARLRDLVRQRLSKVHVKELPPHLLRDIGLTDDDLRGS